MTKKFNNLLEKIKQCQICQDLPLGPKPIVQLHPSAKIMLIGQAPGTKAHTSGIAWNDASGKRLREWLGVTDEQFYDATKFAIMPMGFCYPGKGKSGDFAKKNLCSTVAPTHSKPIKTYSAYHCYWPIFSKLLFT